MNMRRTLLICALSPLSACGGGNNAGPPPATTQPPAPLPPPALATRPAFPNLSFSQPVALRQAPGNSNQWYIVERRGRVHVFVNDAATSTTDVFIDISARVDASVSESGLLGMAFHPNYPTTPEVYLSYTSGPPLTSRVSRFRLDGNGTTLDPASEEVLLQFAQPRSNHNGGDLAFDPAGLLYASFGDGGGGGDPGENAQNTTNLLGTVLRIDVDAGAPYQIPSNNPFVGGALCNLGSGADDCPEIYAWGLRNPWRMSFDSITGELWLGDVGQGDWEEVDRVLGGNYGWNDREGAHCFDPPSACATNFQEPVSEYDHSVGQSVTGGYVYRGTAMADLAGWYVFGDFVSGTLFAVEADSQPTVAPTQLGDADVNIAAFAQDTDGELYVLDYGGGTVQQLVAAP